MLKLLPSEFRRRLHYATASACDPYPDAEPWERDVIDTALRYSLTSRERMWAMVKSTAYLAKKGIPGDVVETGVYKGGSMMAAALTLKHIGEVDRTLWLYDTYEGMPEPTDVDHKLRGDEPAAIKWARTKRASGGADWCFASLAEVQRNMETTGYPRLQFVQGKVEETLPSRRPDQVALLRIDTDWYESTKISLELLWDCVPAGGVVILDDYGNWAGAKQATDEFLSRRPPVLMTRIDESGRLIVKT